jgi:hypothetical protein
MKSEAGTPAALFWLLALVGVGGGSCRHCTEEDGPYPCTLLR